jgi:hypothetical protein
VRGDRCCYLLDGSIPACGRPLTIDGEARTAPVHPSGDWLGFRTPRLEGSLPRAVGQQLAREWLADARLEHASVASFAAFALSLLAVGAPPELLAECQRAGLDEVEHARACFALASRFAGEELGPGRLSLAGLNVATQLEELTLRAWLEGCVEETVAALTASAQLEVATDEPVRSALARIAADEARHAELSWKFVGWALASSGPELRHALTRASERLQPPPVEAVTVPDHDALARLHAHGRLSAAEQRAIRARALREVIRPTLDGLLEAVGASVS